FGAGGGAASEDDQQGRRAQGKAASHRARPREKLIHGLVSREDPRARFTRPPLASLIYPGRRPPSVSGAAWGLVPRPGTGFHKKPPNPSARRPSRPWGCRRRNDGW